MNIKNDLKYFSKKIKYLIGVDEVGRGSLAGPVTVAAILFNKKKLKELNGRFKNLKIELRDSKKLNCLQRQKIYDIIKKSSVIFSVSSSSHKFINKRNINNAIFSAAKRALKKIIEKNQAKNYKVIIDGNLKIPNLEICQEAVIKGDEKLFSIACASIVAKVIRDRIMIRLSNKYPEYYFFKNKGYGTKDHIEILKNKGYCEIHRQNFLKKII